MLCLITTIVLGNEEDASADQVDLQGAESAAPQFGYGGYGGYGMLAGILWNAIWIPIFKFQYSNGMQFYNK